MKVMSIGFFVEEDAAVVWRGPMLHKAIQQFLEDVDWGELDYLLIDLPPGTGDVSMTLAQLLPQAKMLLVTTPQPAAQKVAHRAAEMARQVRPRDHRRGREHVRLHGSRRQPPGDLRRRRRPAARRRDRRAAARARSRSQEELRRAADEGLPLVVEDPDAPAAQALRHLARGIDRRDAARAAGGADAGDGRRARLRRQRAAGHPVAEVARSRRPRGGSLGAAAESR